MCCRCLLQSYRVKIEYLSSPNQSYSARKVCGARCELCRAAGAECARHTDVFAPALNSFDTSSGSILTTFFQPATWQTVATLKV